MVDTDIKITRLLSKNAKYCYIYREILKMLSIHGYLSIDEVVYHTELMRKQADNRMFYLVKVGLVKKFASGTIPINFYCLTTKGRQVVVDFNISDFISTFQPHMYNLMWQRHHRHLVKVWSVFSKVFAGRVINWVSDEQLKKESVGKYARVFDSEVLFDSGGGLIKRCGIELEESLKSPGRYEKQVDSLINYLHDMKHNKYRGYDILFYICSTLTIKDRLKYHLRGRYIEAQIYFSMLDELIVEKGESEIESLVGERKKLKELV